MKGCTGNKIPSNLGLYVRFGALIVVTTKISIILDKTPCSPVKVNRYHKGTYFVHLQGQRVATARNQDEAD
jgi:hypothetical protein